MGATPQLDASSHARLTPHMRTVLLLSFSFVSLIACGRETTTTSSSPPPNTTTASSTPSTGTITATGTSTPTGTLAVGKTAPDFSATAHDGTAIKITALKGKHVVLYFYPKDETPGCTLQACSLRDGSEDLKEAGISVVGVSPDDQSSHASFAAGHRLDFPLVADPVKEILKAYGAWGDRACTAGS